MGQNEIVTVGKNSGLVLSRLWTKVHEILRQRRRPFVLSIALARLSSHHGWRLGVVVSVVGRINAVNQHRARLVHDG